MSAPFDKTPLLAVFKAEAEEHLAALNQGLLRLERSPQQSAVVEGLLRAAHTLKGAARTMGYLPMQEVAHRLEDLFQQLQKGPLTCTAAVADAALAAVDGIQAMLNEAAAGRPITVEVPAVCAALNRCLGVPAYPQPSSPGESTVPPSSPPPVESPAPDLPDEMIRVPTHRVGDLLNLVGELVINKVKSSYKLAALRTLTETTRTVQRHLARLGDRLRPGGDGPSAESADELHRLSHQCTVEAAGLARLVGELADRLSAETVHLDPVIDELQVKTKQLQMLPVATIFEVFERAVRDLAREEQKAVTLAVRGGETELDKKVLERVKPCLIHLLRNAVSHGIERPAARQARGKPPAGTIQLWASHQGDRVVIGVADDGQGIDLPEVRRVAVKGRIVTDEQAGRMDERELLNLIFAPGFSTSPIITDVSGRGIGLDIVRREVESLRGQVTVASRPGEGTTVTIELPLTVAILPVLLVEAEGLRFGLPLLSVEEVLTVPPSQVQTIEQHMTVAIRERTVPLVRLADVLRLPPARVDEDAPPPPVRETWPVAVASSLERRVGFVVDRVLGEEEIFIKGLGRHLGHLSNVSGATILGTGEVIVVLDVAALLLAARLAHPAIAPAPRPPAPSPRRILVVEDSLTTRELERQLLEGHGYGVETAVDGLDALERLTHGTFHLVVSDIQMPRMDGFEFCKILRQRPEFRELPVIFVTALDRDEEKRRGVEVGAQAYIAKGAFDQGHLLQTIERLIG